MLGRTIKAKTGPISESGRAVLAARHYRPVQGVGPVPIQIDPSPPCYETIQYEMRRSPGTRQ